MLNLQSDCIIEGEPSIKNAHTATHLRIYRNQLVYLAIDQAIYVYSLPKIAQNTASLVSIIQLTQAFNHFQKEQYEDFVTSIFRNAQKEDFSTQIFSKSGDTKSNALLKIDSIKDRIVFFNNNTIRVVKFELNDSGDILVLLADGRAAIIQDHQTDQQIINLNEIAKEKIRQVCFVKSQGLCMITSKTIIYIADLKDRAKTVTLRTNIQNISNLHGSINVKERVQLCIATSNELHILQLKKKLTSVSVIKFEEFITSVFYHHPLIFIGTLQSLYEFNLQTMVKRTVTTFKMPTELMYVDLFGSYIPKSNSSTKEQMWLVDSTSNGIFVGQTIRRNGNYKQGRLVIFEPKLEYFIQRLICNIKDNYSYINTKDAIFFIMNADKKALLQQIINLSKSNTLTYKETSLSFEQYNALCINITHAFEGKELVKQKIIQRALKHRLQGMSTSSKQYDLRCCFTGIEIYDEKLSHCPLCNLYGIQQQGNKCVVCFGEMVKYQ